MDTGIIHRVLCITLAWGTPSASCIAHMHMQPHPLGSPLHHPLHSLLHHPGHPSPTVYSVHGVPYGPVMPAGLPPMTPSMPPFTFLHLHLQGQAQAQQHAPTNEQKGSDEGKGSSTDSDNSTEPTPSQGQT